MHKNPPFVRGRLLSLVAFKKPSSLKNAAQKERSSLLFLSHSLAIFVLSCFTGLQSQTPGGITGSGIKLWLRADKGVSNSGGVTQWQDQGPAGKIAKQATAASKPVYNTTTGLINYNPTVRFDGVNDYMTITQGILGTATYNQLQVYAVRTSVAVSSSSMFLEYCSPMRISTHIPWGNGNIYWDAGDVQNGGRLFLAWGGTVGVPYLWSELSDKTASYQRIRRNGLQIAADADALTFKGTKQDFTLGASGGGAGFDNAQYAEMVILGVASTATERLQIESYLALKYGITLNQATPQNYLASNGTVIWNATTNAAYKNNITGIGRDDASDLMQKQSRSVNTAGNGNMVYMGYHTVQTSNALNTNNILANRNFLIWGDNGLTGNQATEYPSALTTGGCLSVSRLKREWKVQETGNIDSVQVRFDLTGIASNSTVVSDLRLLIDDDGDFGNGGTSIVNASSYNPANGIAVFNNISFTSGQYFTVVLDVAPGAPAGVGAGLALWLRADKGILTATGVSNWYDQSANAKDASQTNATLQPAYISSGANLLNYNPCLKWDGTNDYISTNSLFTSSGINNAKIFVVGATDVVQSASWFRELTANGYNINAHVPWTDGLLYWDAPYGYRVSTPWGGTTGKTHLFTFSRSPTNMYASRDRSVIVNNNTTYSTMAGNNQPFYPGGNGNMNGRIGEMIVFNNSANLSAGQQLKIESYLAIKYGITLSQTVATNYLASDSTVIWNASANGIYNNNITGIGRDNCSGLNQKQSRSQNSASQGNPVAIGLDSVALSNATNGSSFAADKRFMFWADDGLTGIKTTEFPTSLNPSGCFTISRLKKEWRVQESGTVGAVQVQLFCSVVSPTSNDLSELKLLVDNDNDFSNGGTTIVDAISYNPVTKIATFASVDFINGQYFTFITDMAATAPGGVSASLKMWLRADKGVSTATGVSTWKDQSVNGNNVLQATAGSQPTYQTSTSLLNFNPVLDFDANDFLDGTGFRVHPDSNSIFAAAVPYDVANYREILGSGTVGSAVGMEFRTTNAAKLEYGESASAYTAVTGLNTLTVNTPYVFTSTSTNATNGIKLHEMGRLDITGTLNISPATANFVSVGSRTIAGRAFYWYGKLPEVILFDRAVSAAEKNKIESYLCLKYGITMNQATATNYTASNGSVIWNATSNSTYKNNIAGIGRDDCGGLKQKQSRSVNSTGNNNFVTIGRGKVATSNDGNDSTFNSDLSFLIWGDDNASLNQQVSEMPSSIVGTGGCGKGKRIGREWRVQVTNYTQGNTVQFNIAALGLASRPAGNFKLAIDADGNFSNAGTIISAAGISGGMVSFNNVIFNDGDYFTLITDTAVNIAPGGVNTNVYTWLRASDVANPVHGASIGTWYDSYRTLDSAAVTGNPVFDLNNTLNYNPMVYYNGTSAHSLTRNLTGGAYTLLGVSRMEGTQNGRVFQSVTTNNLMGYHGGYEGAIYLNAVPNQLTTRTATTNPHLYTMQRASTGSGPWAFREEGRQLYGTTTSNNTAWQANIGGGPLIADQKSKVYVGEWIMFDSSLSASSLNKVESYLALKYGFTLDQTTAQNYTASNGTVYWDATANSTYKSNIAGIGRDECQGLYQKQSRSSNSGSLVAIGVGAVDSNNITNTGTLVNNSFMVWGDDGVSGIKTSEYPSSLIKNCMTVKRLAREWKVQKTGTVPATQVRFFLGNLVASSAVLEDFRLLIDTDNDFSNAGTVLMAGAFDATNKTVTFDNVSFSNGDYFTLVTDFVANAPGGVASGTVRGAKFDLYNTNSNCAITLTGYGTGSSNTTPLYSGYVNNITDDYVLNKVPDPFIEFNATLEVPASSNYTFYFISNDNLAELWIDGTSRLSGACCATLTSTAQALTAGDHTIRVKWLDCGGGGNLQLQWSSAAITQTDLDHRWLRVDNAPLSAWFRANKGVSPGTHGTQITGWEDQAVNNNLINYGGTTVTYQDDETNLINYNPVARFNNSYLATEGSQGLAYGAADRTMFTVATREGGAALKTSGYGYISANGASALTASSTAVGFYALGSSNTIPAYSWTHGNPLLMQADVSAAGTPAVNFRLNEATVTGTSSTRTATFFSGTTGTEFELGGIRGDANKWQGRIPETIIYPFELSDAQRQRVESYLALKYGITLNQTTAYDYIASDGVTKMWDATTGNNTTYKYHIAGIGIDSCSGLIQKQSQSTDTSNNGSMVAMGLNAIALKNASNSSDFNANKTFMVWADDNATGTKTTEVPAALSGTGCNTIKRMRREWKVQETNTVDFVEVRFNMGSYANASSMLEDFRLLIDNDNDFGNGGTTVYEPNSYDPVTKTVSFTNIDFSNNQYFTLVTDISATAPGNVSNNLKMWLRADKGVGLATGVSSWEDQSINGINATQATAGNQPLYQTVTKLVNFNPSLEFNGSSNYLDFSSVYSATDSVNAFFVSSTDITDASYRTLAEFVNDRPGFYWRSGRANVYCYDVTNPDNLHSTIHTAAQPALFSFGLPNATAQNFTIGDNAKEVTVTGIDGSFPVNSGTTKRIGYGDGGGSYFDGLINEVVFYKGKLTALEKQKIQSYLALKYGISLHQSPAYDYIASNGTTKIWDATTGNNPTYKHNITGIGRDDCSGLMQRQSRNQSTVLNAGIVTMGINTIETSNALNTSAIDSNYTFMVWADDSASLSEQTSEMPAILNTNGVCAQGKRIGREWKVQRTARYPGPVQLNIDITSTGINSRSINNFLLAVHSSNDFTGATRLISPVSFADGVLTFSDIIFDAGDSYFTVITDTNKVIAPGGIADNMRLWIKADGNVYNTGTTAATDGQTVESVGDHSGNAYDLSQGTAASQPLFYNSTAANLLNYNPAITFDGSNDYLRNATRLYASTSGFQLFTVAKDQRPALTTTAGIMGTGVDGNYPGMDLQTDATSPNGWNTWMSTSTPTEWTGGGSAILFNGNTGGTGRQQQIFGLSSANGGTNNIESNIDGFFQSTTLDANNQAEIGNGIWMGNSGSTEYWNGQIGELLVYNKNLSNAEKTRVNSYLGMKYGITLKHNYVASNGTTIVWDTTANSGYNKNIAVIGRDDCSGLLQKQSRSANNASNGNMVAIGLNTITTTNTDNIGTFNNMSFVAWGDNNATGSKLSEYPASMSNNSCATIKRLQREWKVQTTSSVDQAEVKFFLSGLVPNTSNISDFKMLIDTDSDFSNGGTTIVEAGDYDAVTQTVTFRNIQFAGTQYFTITIDYIPFAPASVSANLKLWLRADKGIYLGTGVSAWDDITSSANNSSQATAANQPVWNNTSNLVNFNPNVQFDGTNDYLKNTVNMATAITSSNVEAFVVGNISGGTANGGIFSIANAATRDDNTTTGAVLLMRNNTTNNMIGLRNSATLGNSTGLTAGNTYLMESNFNGGSHLLSANGRLQSTTAFASTAFNSNQYSLGARMSGTSGAVSTFTAGSIAEVILYDASTSPLNKQKIRSYLALKYGITLDQTSAYSYLSSSGKVIWDATANGTYKNNIFGIGRDDCSGLMQKQSRSLNTASSGNMLTIALNTLKASNAENTALFNNDSTFLMVADNNGALTESSSDMPSGISGCNKRLIREWKADVTNGSVSTELQFDLSGATVTGTTVEHFSLMIDNDGDGNFTTGTVDVLSAADYTAGILKFSNITLNDGVVFGIISSYRPTGVVDLVNAGSNIVTAKTCTENNWTYFYSPTDSTKKLFAVFTNGNTFSPNSITINTGNGYAASDFQENNAGLQRAFALMPRLVEVNDGGSGPYNVNGGMKVRFYYAPAEKSATQAILDNNKTTYSISGVDLWEWFKIEKTISQVITTFNDVKGLDTSATYPGISWTVPDSSGIEDGIDFAQFHNITDFSTFGGIWSVGVITALPVDLVKFDAVKSDKNVLLSWTTSHEINSNYFTVERSTDGKTGWKAIAQIPAKGNSSDLSTYNTIDVRPENNGVLYYRLQMVDKNGSSRYSPNREVLFPEVLASVPKMIVYPNPSFDSRINIKVSGDVEKVKNIVIYDMQGKMLMTVGKNLNSHVREISNIDLAKGVYLISFETLYGIEMQKVIIH